MLIQAAADGLSGEEMEAKFGIPAAEAIIRVRDILRKRDIWSDEEERRLLLVDLQGLKNQLQSQIQENMDPRHTAVLLSTLKAIGELLSKQRQISDEALRQMSEAQAKSLLDLVVSAFGAAKEVLEREYPEVDIEVIEEVFNVKLIEASRS